jgi:ABC-type antimicrobial peptide transport system permease subunit
MYSRIEAQAGKDSAHRVHFIRVSPGFFDMLGERIVSGRTFTADEAREGLPVAVLSETAARRLLGNRNALGQELTLPWEDEWLRGYGVMKFRHTRVVGVVSDAVAGMIFTGRESPVMFFPVNASAKGTTVLVSVTGPIDATMRTIEAALERAHPGAVNEIFSVQQSLDTQVYPLKAASWVAGLLGGIALILTLSGIYGVLAYLVAQRTREIGIRLALGAAPRAVVRIVVGQSLRLAGIGAAIGLSLALAVSKIFSSAMLVVSTFDALAYFGSVAAALAACVLAAWIPARRAANVNPLEALRSD